MTFLYGIYVMTLQELKNHYGNTPFAIAHVSTYSNIKPKLVTIDENLIVWHDGACIINGMKENNFIHDTSVKSLVTAYNKAIDELDCPFDVKKLMKSTKPKKIL